MKRSSVVPWFLFAVLLLGGCADPGTTPDPDTVSVTDDFGREVAVSQPVERIVSLAPSHTEILFDLGLEDQLVAVTDHDNFPPEVEEYPSVGGFGEPSLEAVLDHEPDLVLASSIHQETVESLEQMEIAVLVLDEQTVEGLWENILTIGQAAGVEQVAAGRVESLQAEVEQAIAPVADLAEEERPLVYYELWHDPLMTAGPDTYVHDLINLAGGRNLAADADKAWPEYSMEIIVERDPEVILRTETEHGEEAVRPEDIAKRPGWSDISAVQTGRIFLVDDDLMSRPGPRLVEILPQLVELFHPETDS